MPRLIPSPSYQAARRALGRNARVALTIVEEGIEAAPHHLVGRYRRDDGVIADYSAERLFVLYRVLDEGVELLDVLDIAR